MSCEATPSNETSVTPSSNALLVNASLLGATAARRVWDHAFLRGWIMDILHRPDGGGSEDAVDEALYKLLRVNKASFDSASERLYEVINGFEEKPGYGIDRSSFFSYMQAVGAVKSRTRFYASKVRCLHLQQGVTSLSEVDLAQLHFMYGNLKTVHVSLVKGPAQVIDTTLNCLPTGVVKDISLAFSCTVKMQDIPNEIFRCDHVGDKIIVRDLKVRGSSGTAISDLVTHIQEEMVTPKVFDYSFLESLDLSDMPLTTLQLTQLGNVLPSLRKLKFSFSGVMTDSDLEKVLGRFSGLCSLEIQAHPTGFWRVPLKVATETLCKILPDLRSLEVPYNKVFESFQPLTEIPNPFLRSTPTPFLSCPHLDRLSLSIMPVDTFYPRMSGMDVSQHLTGIISSSCEFFARVSTAYPRGTVAGAEEATQLRVDIEGSRRMLLHWMEGMKGKVVGEAKTGWKHVNAEEAMTG